MNTTNNIKKFEDFGLSPEILKSLHKHGYINTTEIQKSAMPLMMEGNDLIACSQTGSGKTLAYAIPSLEKINFEIYGAQVLVLCPTRELALQICEEIRKACEYKEGIRTLAIFGGEPIYKQIRALKSHPQIIVGTPGRVIDHIRRKTLKLNDISLVVLDEADEMLSMGFIDDINIILTLCPKIRQTVLFSATMPGEIIELTKKYLKNPKTIRINTGTKTAIEIDQIAWDVPKGYKIEYLFSLYEKYKPARSLIFCNTKVQVDKLVNILKRKGFHADALHGDMLQKIRTKVMTSFKNGELDILVATDIAARGIDVDDIDIVFNYDLPQDRDYYVHRIGRTARAGKKGIAITLAEGKKEVEAIKTLARYIGTSIKIES